MQFLFPFDEYIIGGGVVGREWGLTRATVFKQKNEVRLYIRICIRVNPISIAVSNLYICGCLYMRVSCVCSCCACTRI